MVMCDGDGPRNRHEEIVYDGGECPLCAVQDASEDMDKVIGQFRDLSASVAERIAANLAATGVTTEVLSSHDHVLHYTPIISATVARGWLKDLELLTDAMADARSKVGE